MTDFISHYTAPVEITSTIPTSKDGINTRLFVANVNDQQILFSFNKKIIKLLANHTNTIYTKINFEQAPGIKIYAQIDNMTTHVGLNIRQILCTERCLVILADGQVYIKVRHLATYLQPALPDYIKIRQCELCNGSLIWSSTTDIYHYDQYILLMSECGQIYCWNLSRSLTGGYNFVQLLQIQYPTTQRFDNYLMATTNTTFKIIVTNSGTVYEANFDSHNSTIILDDFSSEDYRNRDRHGRIVETFVKIPSQPRTWPGIDKILTRSNITIKHFCQNYEYGTIFSIVISDDDEFFSHRPDDSTLIPIDRPYFLPDTPISQIFFTTPTSMAIFTDGYCWIVDVAIDVFGLKCRFKSYCNDDNWIRRLANTKRALQ